MILSAALLQEEAREPIDNREGKKNGRRQEKHQRGGEENGKQFNGDIVIQRGGRESQE